MRLAETDLAATGLPEVLPVEMVTAFSVALSQYRLG